MLEIGLETVPPHLEHVATNRFRNHFFTHQGQKTIAGRQARLLQILGEHTRCAPRGGEGVEYSPALIFDWNFVPCFYLKCPILFPIFDLICALLQWIHNSRIAI